MTMEDESKIYRNCSWPPDVGVEGGKGESEPIGVAYEGESEGSIDGGEKGESRG